MRPSNHLISKAAWNIVIIMLGVMFSAQKLAAIEQSEKEMKKLVERSIEIYNTGDISIIDEICAPDLVRYFHGKKSSAVGIDAFKKGAKGHRNRYPDMKITIDEMIIAHDKVVFRYTYTGTQTGPGKIPPTGKRVTIHGIYIYKIVEGKIAEIWMYWNNQKWIEQLGYTITPPTIAVEE